MITITSTVLELLNEPFCLYTSVIDSCWLVKGLGSGSQVLMVLARIGMIAVVALNAKPQPSAYGWKSLHGLHEMAIFWNTLDGAEVAGS
jgi:hypothetical protein